MSRVELIRQFKKFLVEQDCLMEFTRNVKATEYTNLKTLYRYAPVNWITSAFSWHKTPEKSSFWIRVHIAWEKRYKQF